MNNKIKEVKIITAQEARTQTEESKFLLRLAYKVISESANRNECRTYLNIKDNDEKAISDLKTTLSDTGFKVSYYRDEDPEGVENSVVDYDTLVIEW